MKRTLFSIVGTIAGLAALLGFKSHSTTALKASTLPSAALGSTSSGSASSGSTSTGSTPSTIPSSSAATASPSSPSSASSAATTTTRTVVGSAEQTQYGIVQIEVTAKGKTITNVRFVQLTAFDQRSQEINQAAAPILLQQTLQAQSANINGVSGATFTSQGYVTSLQSALDKL